MGILVYSFGVRVCALTGYRWVSGFLGGIAGPFHDCLGLVLVILLWEGPVPGEGDGNRDISARSGGSWAAFWEDGMACPEPLPGTCLPM